ncbi:MAG TPA: PD-(D/E)XK nuclease family protein [Firmicutes bacterium]|nr:PD-(D/E)XK nuclease family protein [Bacillota bacterium]
MKVVSVYDHFTKQDEENVITVSRISSANCLYSYYKSYIESPKPKPDFETIEIGLGSFFHGYLENKFKEIQAENREIQSDDIIDLDKLLTDFRLSFIWEGKLIEPYRIIRKNSTVEDYIEKLKEFGKNFNGFLRKNMTGHKIFDVEGDLEIETDEYLIRGKYDLISRDPDGNLVLWDWKTGPAPNPKYFDDYKQKKLQLGIYAIWMGYKFPEDQIKGSVVFLKGEAKILSEKFTKEIERDVLFTLKAWRDRMNIIKGYPPKPTNLCSWCAWKSDCPAWKK